MLKNLPVVLTIIGMLTAGSYGLWNIATSQATIMSNINHSIKKQEELYVAFAPTKDILTDLRKVTEQNYHMIKDVEMGMLNVVYVNDTSVLVSTYSGRVFRIPILDEAEIKTSGLPMTLRDKPRAE